MPNSKPRTPSRALRLFPAVASLLVLSACTNSGFDLGVDSTLGLETLSPSADVGNIGPVPSPPRDLAAQQQNTVLPVMRQRPAELAAALPSTPDISTVVPPAPMTDPIGQIIAQADTQPVPSTIKRPTTLTALVPVEEPEVKKKRPNLLSYFKKPQSEEPVQTARRRPEPRTTGSIPKKEVAPRTVALSPSSDQVEAAPVAAAEVASTTPPRPKGSMVIIRPKKNPTLAGVRSVTRLYGVDRQDKEAGRAFRVASAAGLARRSASGFVTQTSRVDTACLKPELLAALKDVENHFGKRLIITSGFRSPKINAAVGGAKGSKHMTCEAADFQVEGVSRQEVAAYLRSMPGRGGVGTYCHTKSVHYDIGSKRDWSWGCRRRG